MKNFKGNQGIKDSNLQKSSPAGYGQISQQKPYRQGEWNDIYKVLKD